FNTVGPRQNGAYGYVLPRLVAQALLGRELTIYGDGTQTRCFCDVEDAVRAVVGLLDEPKATGEVFNVGSEEEISIHGLAERVLEVTGSSSAITCVPYDQAYGEGYEDIPRRVPDTAKIRNLLGWVPHYDLDGIIKRQIAFATDVGPQTLLDTRGR
ncbi:MAG: GDP-mannose 4,6-dehydratase, partial [Candidatus Binatia bacterium]